MNTDRCLRPAAGFTLIELLVTLVIVAILTAIAYPAYTDYVRRGYVPQATAALLQAQVAMEQYFQDERKYTDALPVNGCPPAATEFFTFACAPTAGPPATFTVTATGRKTMAGFTYTIDQTGLKTSTTPWGNSGTCWVRGSGGAC
jgi:type IV pilus assembly protein PilE